MALKWIPNELTLKHKDVSIYHIYRYDDHEGGVRQHFFGLDEYGSDDGTDDGHIVFDVRDLPSYDSKLDIKDVLRKAIDNGEITQDYVKTEG